MRNDRATIPADVSLGLVPAIPPDVAAAAAQLVRARAGSDVDEILAALGLEGVT
jgi:hypothetical protein